MQPKAPDDTLATSATMLAQMRRLDDGPAWQRFWDRYKPAMLKWARQRGLADAEAEEVVAQVAVRLVRAMPTFEYDEARSFRGWLCRAVANAVNDAWRARERHPGGRGAGDSDVQQLLNEEPAPDSSDLSEQLTGEVERRRQAELQAVERTKARVEERSWLAFWQVAIENRPGKEVAQELGMSVAAVHMARGRVARILREEMDIVVSCQLSVLSEQ